MNFSYWELKQWFQYVDFAIIGSGIVGLNCAISLKNKYPKANILILEKGILPQGASTKNAGFACFGSLSELIDDLKTHSEQEVFDLVKKRWEGLQLLQKNLGKNQIDFQQNKGFELFLDELLFQECLEKKQQINQLLFPIFKEKVFSTSKNIFQFNSIHQQYIVNKFEGQIDTGKMMVKLLNIAHQKGIKIINSINVLKLDDDASKVLITTDKISFTSKNVCIATNGFANQLIQENVVPARAQVLVTKPIDNLHIKGTFHLDKGFYYFRNIDQRILLGGGRNLDFKTEETTEFACTSIIQNKLEQLLKTMILPNTPFEIAHRWSGIMGVGNQKKAIVKQLSAHVFCGVRLGGMGVAIGSYIGNELTELIKKTV